jgi:hypothetical protein
VLAMMLSARKSSVGRLKRQLSMPLSQSDSVNVKSPPLRALTK